MEQAKKAGRKRKGMGDEEVTDQTHTS